VCEDEDEMTRGE